MTKFMGSPKGASSNWKKIKSDVVAVVRQSDVPTFFLNF